MKNGCDQNLDQFIKVQEVIYLKSEMVDKSKNHVV